MAVERKIFAQGGMNSDSAPDFVAANDYLPSQNIRLSGTQEGDADEITNIEGNTIIASTRPNGINKCIGAFGFELVRFAVAFIYNSNGLNLITKIDYDTLTETTVFENKTNSGGNDILPLDPQKYVTDCKLLQGKYLIFTYGTVPYYVNLEQLQNGLFATVVQEDLLLQKGQPLTEPTVVYNNDTGRSVNSLKNRLFQFRTQFEKQDFERTTWGTISKRVVPTDEPTPSFGTNVTVNNNLIVSVNIGSDRNERINIAGRYDMLDWFLVKSVDRKDIISLPNTTVDVSQEIYEAYDPSTNIYSFAFYNDENYENIDVLETDENYDHIWNAETLELINGSILALGGLNEGYERPVVDVDISVSSYDPNIRSADPSYDFFKVTATTNQRVSGSHRRRVTISFGGLPKTGDKVFIQLRNIGNYADVQNYSYTIPSTVEDNLNGAVALVATSVPNTSVINGNTIGFLTTSYFELASVKIDLANAGTGVSKSIHGVKSNSSYQLALAHYDDYGRYFPIVTDKRFVQKTPSFALTRGLLSKFDWQINSSPPLKAKTYQWLISLNLTHATDLWVNGGYAVIKSSADYLVFNIKSLQKFNTTNSSSILNYEYSEGDRVTFHYTFLNTSTPIKWFDTVAIDVEVVGFEIVVDTTTEPDTTNYYLKVRKSASLVLSDIIEKEVLLEIYSPRKRATTNPDGSTTLESTLFYEIGERYDIVNGDYSVKQGSITEGDNYFKTRNLEGNFSSDDDTLYGLVVEDFNFSDFYKSDYTSYGRARSYYDEVGNVDRKASIRYSDTFVTGSRINGINRFYGARIYGDGAGETSSVYGWVRKIRMRDNYLVCIQELKVGHIPVNMSIVEDQVEQRQYAISDKLLNFVRYLSGNYGIGDAKESYGESQNGTIYFADPNNSLPIRDGYDGLKVISAKMTKFFRRVLKQAKSEKKKIIGWYDVFNDEYNLNIEIASGVLTTFNFSDFEWEFEDSYTVNPADLVVTANSNGVAVVNTTTGVATFTPNNNYVGNAGFTFTFLSGGNLITKNVCGTVEAGTIAVNPFYFIDLLNQEINTLLVSNSILISGINIPVAVSIVGGEYRINGGAWTSVNGTVVNGDTVEVRRNSSVDYEATVSATLTVGAYSDSFDITTKEETPVIACGVEIPYSGGVSFPTEIEIILGTDTGDVVLNSDAYGVPDKIIVEFDGVEVLDTGYRGDADQQTALDLALADMGLPPEPIVGTGRFTSYFEKTTATTTAIVKIFAPLSGTSWNLSLDCPVPNAFNLITPSYGTAGTNSINSCVGDTDTENLYKLGTKPFYVGMKIYKEDGLGGYEPFNLTPLGGSNDPFYYWLSFMDGSERKWFRMSYDTTGVHGDTVSLIGNCPTGTDVILEIDMTVDGVLNQISYDILLSEPLSEDLLINAKFNYSDGTGEHLNVPFSFNILAGNTGGIGLAANYTDPLLIYNVYAEVTSATPNPNGSINIIY